MIRYKLSRRLPDRRRAAAAVEFGVVLPILLVMLLGIWEVGRVLQVRQILNNAAREGARQAASGQISDPQVKIAVCAYLKNAGLPDYSTLPDTVVTVSNLTHPGTDSLAATSLDQIRVTVSIPSKDVRWVVANYFTPDSFRVSDSAVWYSTKNAVYPPTAVSPPGY
jgi:Flp pilus assembly protein TadG